MDYHDGVEEAEEVIPATENTFETDKQDEKLLDIECDSKSVLELEGLDANSSSSKNETVQSTSTTEHKKELSQLFDNFVLDNNVSYTSEHLTNNTQGGNQSDLDRSFTEQNSDLNMFDKSDTNFNLISLSALEAQDQEQSLQSLTSENMALLSDILSDKQSITDKWEALSSDTFLPPNILKQSLGDVALGIGQKSMPINNTGEKVSKNEYLLIARRRFFHFYYKPNGRGK